KDVSAVGALAVAPSAHDTVWAGTGEPWLIRPYYTLGDGVYKSTDAGRTWQHMGLDATGHIARIVIDPRDANSVYVCAIGQAFRTQKERGVFHTTDGGASWQPVLAVDENTGCSDLAMDPKDSKTLYAGMWQLIIHRYDLHSGGPGSGVYVTHDGGATWSKIAARPGSSSISRTCRRNARATTRGWPCRPTTRTCSTFRPSPSPCRATAERRCSRPAVAVAARAAAAAAAPHRRTRTRPRRSPRRAATTMTSGSIRRTPIVCSSPTTPASPSATTAPRRTGISCCRSRRSTTSWRTTRCRTT